MTLLAFRKLVSLYTMITLACFSSTVFASNQNNCDIRKLNLTSAQKNKMRLIRVQYKNNINNMHSSYNTQNNNQLIKIMMQPNFDETQVRQYILKRYAEKIEKDVDELKVQYTFLQILDRKQRQNWVNNCLR